jgi:cell division protein FtsQ
MALQRLPIFPLRQLVVTGPIEQVTRAQLEDAAHTALAGNFFTVDLDAAQAQFEKLPWVRRAELRRHWPDGLDLVVEEQVAVARWRSGDGESRLVNDHGEVFAAACEQPLPVLSGPQGSAPMVLARFREFGQGLAAIGRRPASVSLSAREAWQLKLDDGIVVELGRDDARHNLSDRLARFVTYFKPALEKVPMVAGVVDMRYPNGFTLRPAQNRS